MSVATNACGGCTACCTIMRVDLTPVSDEAKPARCVCAYAERHGCSIYDNRPTACQEWSCVWRYTQDEDLRDLRMASALRPDRSGVVLEINAAGNMVAHCRRPQDWQCEPMRSWLIGKAARVAVLLEFGDGIADPLLLRADGSTVPLVQTGVDPVTNNRLYKRAAI